MARTTRRQKTKIKSKAQVTFSGLVEELNRLTGELIDQTDPRQIMKTLAARLVERYRMTTTGVWVAREDAHLELTAIAGKPSFPPRMVKTRPAGTLLGKALRLKKPQVLARGNRSRDELSRWAEKNKIEYLGAFPLVCDGRAQGVLLAASRELPSESMLALLQVQVKLLAVLLRNAELIVSTQYTLEKLSILVESSKAMSSTLDLSELLARILDIAKTQAGAERGTLFLVDEKAGEIWSLIAQGLEKQEIRLPLGKGIAGHVAKTGQIVNIPDAYADPRFNPEVDKRTGYHTRNILCLPIRNKAGKIIASLQLLNKKKGSFSDEDTDFLLTLSGHMALALENAQLHQQVVEKERMEKELALARGIQRSLLPESTPTVEGFDVALLNEPCYAVGGDYYDFLSLGPRALLVVIADVEGKGVSSALVMSNLQATLRALVMHLHSLNEIAEALNKMIWNHTRAEKYMSLFMGLIDVRRKAIHYINCGHVPPVIVRPGSEPLSLTDGGMVVGLFEDATYERGQLKLQPGDILVLCTDGITESMDAHHEEYGAERLIKKVNEVAEKAAAEIVEHVATDVARYSRQGTHIDDKVMIAIKTL
jgi:sigma-B regulation protein RsbU (phosphoserine phosphatase)